MGIELGIGESILMKAIAESTGRTMPSLKATYDQLGDLGLVAQSSRNKQRTMFAPPKLTIQSVFKKLKEIASMQGASVINVFMEQIFMFFAVSKQEKGDSGVPISCL